MSEPTRPANLLLLDEPTNDLDRETLASLEVALEKFPGCAVVISHDRFFLDRVATHILAYEGDSHSRIISKIKNAASARMPTCLKS